MAKFEKKKKMLQQARCFDNTPYPEKKNKSSSYYLNNRQQLGNPNR